MSKLSSLTRISRQDLQGAPDWVDPLLQASNEFQEQATASLDRDLLVGKFVDADLVDAVESIIKSPFGSTMPIGVSNVRCQGLETDASGKSTGGLFTLGVLRLDWRPLQGKPGEDAKIGATAYFSTASKKGRVTLRFDRGP